MTKLITLVYRIEKEIEALETQELNISANEEIVLKRLKEVERTAEDIIKVGSKNFMSFCLLTSVLLMKLFTPRQ